MDFGHLIHHRPKAVVRPHNADEVAEAVRRAGREGVAVAAQGQRHSVWGRSQAAGGVVVEMGGLRAVHGVQSDRVTVDAGATWSEVLGATLARGLTPPVLTDYLELSVGGTLVVGGVGGTTRTLGAQSDNVVEIEVVTGRGEQVTCSAERNTDLFDAVRAGLGQAGIITRATLKLVAAPRSVRRFLLHYPDLAAMLDDARMLDAENRFDVVQGAIVPLPDGDWTFRLDVASYTEADLGGGLHDDPAQRQPMTLTYADYLRRLAALESALRGIGHWEHPHPWLVTFLGDSQVQEVVGDELARLDPATDLGQLGQILLCPIRTAAITSPLMRLPAEDLCYMFGLVRLPSTADIDAANLLVERNKALYQRIRAAGGTLYPGSAALPMSPEDWRLHFGPAYDRLADAKRRHDPSGILTPGYEVS